MMGHNFDTELYMLHPADTNHFLPKLQSRSYTPPHLQCIPPFLLAFPLATHIPNIPKIWCSAF